MKKVTLSLACAAFLAVSCNNNPKGDKAKTTDETEVVVVSEGSSYSVNTTESTVRWTGRKVSGSHTGTVNIQSGSIALDEYGKPVGGEFVIDMNSIANEDLKADAENRSKLENHLKSDDFFAVQAHPESKFVITDVRNVTDSGADISGNLTLRGVTKNITFPVTITENTASSFIANADFNINRKDWGVMYQGMKDDLIADEINFKVTVKVNK